jgi:DNA-binding helix-hairpin-helix protein with protein kinase domain
VFLDPATGDVQICDNDNVDVSGAAPSGILGTPRFMAPEVVRTEAPPSDMTDRHSLAVLLFYLLFHAHPLEGEREAKIKCLDLPALNQLYGASPVYIFDPKDSSNRPVRGIHDNALIFKAIYPAFLLQAFERAFTEGLHTPQNRIRESEWRKIFGRARDLLAACSQCGAQCFFNPDGVKGAWSCWSCRRALPAPVQLELEGSLVVVQPGTKLFPHHLQQDPYNYVTPLAEVTQHPQDPTRLGLKNLTAEGWTFTKPDGSTVDVPPGRNAPLVDGNRIHFGAIHGTVKAP